MSPWWQRPTSEGAANEEKQEQADKSESTPALPAKPASPATAPTAPTADSDAASRFRSEGVERVEGVAGSQRASDSFHAGRTGDAGAAAPVTPAAGPAPEAEPFATRRADTSHPAQQLDLQASPEHSEPYRAFWEPRESVPSQEAAPGPLQPAAAAAPAAGSRTPEGTDLGNAAAPAPPPAEPAESAGYPGNEAAARARHEPRRPRPIAAPFQSSEPAEPAASEPIELEAEAEGDGEAEERDEESRPEVKKKRSRRSRGGRRKNGRPPAGAAGAGGADPAEEDDDEDAGPEELAAQFQPAPSASPAPGPLQLTPRASRTGESYVISANDLDSASREIIISVPDRQRPQHEERKIAVFCDFENIALGVRDSEISKFDIGLILERLLEKGKIIVKKAYADWERYSDYKRPFHEAAIELIDIPQKFYSGKNSADIKMVVDAMDLSYSKEHLDTFVILSGDSDFSPLVSKLKENNKYVIGIGVKNSSSNLLVDNCDEFIYYEDIWRDAKQGPKLDGLSKKTAEAFSLMVESIQALVRENKDVLWGSMIKQTMQRKKPSFNEGYYGYSTFSELLEDAERKNIVKLKKDQRSGTYIVTGFAKSGDAGPGRRQA